MLISTTDITLLLLQEIRYFHSFAIQVRKPTRPVSQEANFPWALPCHLIMVISKLTLFCFAR